MFRGRRVLELVYLWIEKYGCFTDDEFHFNNIFEFKCEKEDGILTISDSPTKIVNRALYEENIKNISIIVGDNGAGKTSLLRGIIDFLATYEDYGHSRGFLGAFYDRHRKELKIFSFNIPAELKLIVEECKTVTVNTMDRGRFREIIQQTKLIFMSNVLDLNDYAYQKNGHIIDASIGGLLRNDFLRNRENHYINSYENQILNYFNNEVYRQLNFLYGYKPKNVDKIIPFKLPDTLRVKGLKSGERLEDVIGELQKHNPINDISENLTPEKRAENKRITNLVHMIYQAEWQVEIGRKQRWIINLVENLFLSALLEVMRPNTTNDIRKKELKCLLDAYRPYQGEESLTLYIRSYLARAMQGLREVSIYWWELIPYLDFLRWLDNNNLFEFDLEHLETDSISIKLNESNKKRFQEFFFHYNKTCQPYYYLNFSWGLSTGENNLLSLYAKLYSVLEVENNGRRGRRVINHFTRKVKCSNVLLLIDEADLSFHPKWQVQYVDSLLKMVTDLFRNCQVQIILTTHSPILLSDVPKSNVIYLKQGVNDSVNNHQETFGQNIHTLFTDAFFLDKATGHFSDQIIKEVGDGLDKIAKRVQSKGEKVKNESKLKYYKSIISIIGEPIIRKAFEFKLKEVEAAYQTETLKEAINLYNDLSPEDRDLLIQYIISTSEKGTNYEED
ncbi:hypothetical protein COM20_26780 [Bacillus toyonensis]|nr:hypothetical protein COM20_26780 [Bacillus toyonensis]